MQSTLECQIVPATCPVELRKNAPRDSLTLRMSGELNLFPQVMSLAVHELRTPVTVVAGYLRMVLRDQAGPLTDKQRKMLEEADRSCSRIGALVTEMSELGKLEAGSLTLTGPEFDLSALITEVASGMHEGEDRGITLETRGTDRPVMVAGDRPRLAAVLRALMHAALRERADAGAIIVDCSTFTETNQEWVIVAVGAEHDLRPLIDVGRAAPGEFDEWRGGLGLSLPVGRRVVEAHGGALWSSPGDRPRAGSALRLPVGARAQSASSHATKG
jgi:signal transduction histidine kinase